MKQPTIAGKDVNQHARNVTSKQSEPTGKGTSDNVDQKTIAGKNTEVNKKARKKTKKSKAQVTGKGTSDNVKQPVKGGADTSHVVRELFNQIIDDLDLTEEQLSELNEANHEQKAKDMFMDMKKKRMKSDDMVDVMISLAKSSKPKDRKVAEELAELLANDGHLEEVKEAIVKRVSSKGKVTRRKDRKTRQKRATQTTGLSKSKRRQIARKAARTKKANPATQRKASRKQKRAMRKRKSMGY